MKTAPQPPLPLATVCENSGEECSPFSRARVVLTRQEHIQLKSDVSFWRGQHGRAVERERRLKADVEHLKGQVRDLNQRLYGKRSERSSQLTSQQARRSTRKRGHQKGAPGHGRTARCGLPVVEEIHDLAEHEKYCPSCGNAFLPFPKTENSQIVEVKVHAHIRKIIRRQYRKGCDCIGLPGLISAPPAARVIPKSVLGVSVWASVLLDKYLYSRPTHRLCQELLHQGLPVAQGTLTDGLRKLSPLFEPLMAAMLEKQMGERLFHGDETTWKVFEKIQDKVGYRWYLWIMQSTSVIYYRMAPGRGADVPKGHFAGLGKEVTEVILVCDRYIGYKSLAAHNEVIVLAFCWAHVRRDFLDAARRDPELEQWMFTWVEDIGELYHLNGRRLECWDPASPLPEQSRDFLRHHNALCQKLESMANRRDACLEQKPLRGIQKKVLESLKNHWQGLGVFLKHPQVAMDNNTAERSVRNPVTGRKNYYGSGSVWSAHLAASLFTVLQTVQLWGLNPRHWLVAYLNACADNGAKPPSSLAPFLPWVMDDARRQQLSKPLAQDWPSLANSLAQPDGADTS